MIEGSYLSELANGIESEFYLMVEVEFSLFSRKIWLKLVFLKITSFGKKSEIQLFSDNSESTLNTPPPDISQKSAPGGGYLGWSQRYT